MVNNFNLVRLFAAWLVLFGHGFQFLGQHEPVFMSSMPLGPLGVFIFFSISGFLVTQSWQSDPDLIRFFARRALRIFPGLAVCILLTAFVLGPLISTLPASEYFSGPFVKNYLYNIALYPVFYLPGVFETNTIPNAVNGSLWSLPVEFMAYIILAFTLFLIRNKWLYLLVCSVLLAATVFWVPQLKEPVIFYATDLRQLFWCGSFFWVGSLIAVFRIHEKLSLTWVTLAIVAIICLEYYIPALQVMLRFLLPIAIIGFGLASSQLISKLTHKHDYSYGIYIYAFPVQQSVVHLFPEISLPIYMVVCTAITLLLAYLSWNLVEKPALKLKPKTRKQPSTQPAERAVATA